MKKERLSSENGFTLIELMVVCFVMMIVLSFPVVSFKRAQEQMEIDLFFEQMVSGMTLIQSQAVFNDKWTQVEVRPAAQEVRFTVRGGLLPEVSHRLTVPDSMTIVGTSKSFSFNSGSGNINNFSPINIETSRGRYQISYQLGSGRFEVRPPK